ncbi:hypothetical protein B0A49_08812 [Cryomyces minteri]|uniref:Mitotic checkpoint regulator, MAD2B-interacting-domain-containing protein n=1 Tax=Cryomyces minteri TaxID=331657 RepID=A0A4U0XA39_9PEZI|nr:hypothetical protein B0A49_08812 [Cryomyces minteri]
MVLVGYSDSESSDSEATSTSAAAAPKPSASAKPSFQKVVDRSNPRKIKVNLPVVSNPDAATDETDEDAPAAKKARTGGFNSFNALLPAPKKTGAIAASAGLGGGRRGAGLGRGVSLKTGAEPAFSREPESGYGASIVDEASEPSVPTMPGDASTNDVARGALSLPTKSEEVEMPATTEEAPKPVAKPLMFKPLSVARNAKKKIPSTATASKSTKPPPQASSTRQTAVSEDKPVSKAKVSLFSISHEDTVPAAPWTSSGAYEPMIYEAPRPRDAEADTPDAIDLSTEASSHDTPNDPPPTSAHPSDPPTDSLATLANTLNLPPSARRQLLGRPSNHSTTPTAIKSFNADAEYASNEVLRAAGETVAHNPVKAIAPGKHSLQQLVSAAASQKDALEEHFAKGVRGRREAGGRYGW